MKIHWWGIGKTTNDDQLNDIIQFAISKKYLY